MSIISQLAKPNLGIIQTINAAVSNFPRSPISQGAVSSAGSQYLTLTEGMWDIRVEFEDPAAEVRLFIVPAGSSYVEISRANGSVQKLISANTGDRVYIGIYFATITPGQKALWSLSPLKTPI